MQSIYLPLRCWTSLTLGDSAKHAIGAGHPRPGTNPGGGHSACEDASLASGMDEDVKKSLNLVNPGHFVGISARCPQQAGCCRHRHHVPVSFFCGRFFSILKLKLEVRNHKSCFLSMLEARSWTVTRNHCHEYSTANTINFHRPHTSFKNCTTMYQCMC